MFLGKNTNGSTAWHLAAYESNLDSLSKLWELGKEVLTPDELSNKLLLAKDMKK